MGSRGQAGLLQGSADTRPLPAPSLQASAPGSAVDYPLQGLVTHTNYTATLRGLRGPNFTSPASITFTTGVVLSLWGSLDSRIKVHKRSDPSLCGNSGPFSSF